MTNKQENLKFMLYDVIIIGSGPAGLTAAIYTTRANLKTLVIAGTKWGGQLMLTTLVENFPGFPGGIQGPELMINMRKQAEKHGAEIIEKDFKEGEFNKRPFEAVTADGKKFLAKSVIIATGTDTRWFGIKGEKELIGHGVSACAPCDAPFFRNKEVIVAGGGDSAMEEALVLSRFAAKVTIVHRGSEFRASKVMQEKAKNNPKISFIFNTEVVEIIGDQKVTGVKLKSKINPSTSSGQRSKMPIDGVFMAIGHMPNSSVFKGIEIDEQGYIAVKNHTQTNIPGVFAAGDVHDFKYKQAITAAGFGCAAALEVERWLGSGL